MPPYPYIILASFPLSLDRILYPSKIWWPCIQDFVLVLELHVGHFRSASRSWILPLDHCLILSIRIHMSILCYVKVIQKCVMYLQNSMQNNSFHARSRYHFSVSQHWGGNVVTRPSYFWQQLWACEPHAGDAHIHKSSWGGWYVRLLSPPTQKLYKLLPEIPLVSCHGYVY